MEKLEPASCGQIRRSTLFGVSCVDGMGWDGYGALVSCLLGSYVGGRGGSGTGLGFACRPEQ